MSIPYTLPGSGPLVVAQALIFGFLCGATASVQSADLNGPVTEPARGAGDAKTADIGALLSRSAEGPVRVIVEIDIGPQLEKQPNSRDYSETARAAAIATTRAAVMDRLVGVGVSNVRTFQTVPMLAMDATQDALLRLASDPAILHIQEDVAVPPNLDDTVPLIGAAPLHSRGFRGLGASIAILDSGVDSHHPFLRGRVIAEACFSTSSAAAGSRSVCPNSLGEQVGRGAAQPCNAAIAGCFHGTFVAGIAAGGGERLRGVAPRAKIVAIQVFSRFSGDNCRQGEAYCARSFQSDQIAALEYLRGVSQRYRVVAANMSLGGSDSSCFADPLRGPIAQLRAVGVATVISSGNHGYQGTLTQPACIPSAVSVGATTKYDRVWSGSNFAKSIDLMAPGEDIRSSVPGGSFARARGTSFAAPHVAGAFALLRGRSNRGIGLIEEALKLSGRTVRRGGIAKSRIQVDAALADLQMNNIRPPNDYFYDATSLKGTNHAVAGFNENSTRQINEPTHAGIGGYSSVWWKWEAPVGGRVRIDTGNSRIDTVLAVYQGNSINSLREIASNDDDPRFGRQSKVLFRVTAGQTFQIAVAGKGDAKGDLMINLDYVDIDHPLNDNLSGASPLSGSSGTVTGTNRGATKEPGEPRHNGTGGGKTVWWKWQAPYSGNVVFTTVGSNFDTVLAAYRGFQVSGLRRIASNDDDRARMGQQSRVLFGVTRGFVYRVAVDGWRGSEGDIQLRFQRAP